MRAGHQHLKKMKDLNNCIIITGSEGQVGTNLVKLLSNKNNNYRLILLDNERKIKKNYFKVNLENEIEIETFFKVIKKKYKKVFGLINLAAFQVFTDFEQRNVKEIDTSFNINVRANILLSQLLFNNYFKKQKEGKIINISSIYGIKSPDFSIYRKKDRKSSEIYGATKASIIQLTKYFANYMSKYKINVNCISPGGLENKNKQKKNFIRRYSAKVPLNRMGKVDELSNLILFLLDNKSNYINGQNIIIDGGYNS
jgi:NAD(P)-dependent dehydrogenase (short-subunit alcohol dehydrogenase family)